MSKEQMFQMVKDSYKHSDNFPIMVGDKIYVCFGGVDFHDHNETIQFKDCSSVSERCFDGGYDGEVENDKVDIYLINHLWEYENRIETIFYADELIEIIAQ